MIIHKICYSIKHAIDRLSKQQCARLALYCVENVISLLKEQNRILSIDDVVDCIAEYLETNERLPDYQLQKKLREVAFRVDRRSIHFASSAIKATYSLYEGNYKAETYNTVIETVEENKLFGRLVISKYLAVANSFRSYSTIQTKLIMSKVLQKDDPITILALFDELQEYGENIIQVCENNLRLNLPEGYEVTGRDNIDLANNCIKDKLAFDWLNRVYDQSKE